MTDTCWRKQISMAGTNVTSLFSESMKGSLKSAQSQLVSIGSLGHGAQYVIVAKNDYFALPLDVKSLTCAVDRLLKFFWLCNLQYPKQMKGENHYLVKLYTLFPKVKENVHLCS